jgi:hypothetical protein
VLALANRVANTQVTAIATGAASAASQYWFKTQNPSGRLKLTK